MKPFSALLVLICMLAMVACQTQENSSDTAPEEEEEEEIVMPYTLKDSSNFVDLGDGVKLYMVREGKGPVGTKDNEFQVMYHGTLMDGRTFESTYDRNAAIQFKPEKVIKGWRKAVFHAKEGSVFKIIVPPSQGYGNKPKGRIPPNSTIIFDMHLMKVVARVDKKEEKK